MRTTLLHLALIALTIAAVFGRSVNGALVSWDDEDLITNNPHVADGKLDGLAWHWTHPHERLYIPVVYTTWWCISAAAGINPSFFHAANLLVYLGCCWLVYAFIRRFVGHPWAAFAGAMLFAVHPLQVEPVAWATGMKDLLCTFFSLSALVFYLRPRCYWVATLCFVAAMLCKPAAVTLPLIAATIDWILFHRQPRQIFRRLSPWLMGAIAIGFLTAHVQPASNLRTGPLWARPLLASDAIDWYLYKLIWPINLAIDYGHVPLRVLSWRFAGIPWIAVAWMIPAALVGVLVYLRRPMLTACALIFFLALLPVLGFQPFNFQRYSTVADRYADFALLGPALVVAWLLSRWKNRAVFWIVLFGLLGLAAASFLQTGYWSDDLTLYRHAIAINPVSAMAHNNLSVALYRQGDKQAAAAEFAEVMRLAPDQPDAYIALGDFQLQKGKTFQQSRDDHEARQAYRMAIDLFSKGLKLDPDNQFARDEMREAQAGLNAP